MSQFKCVLAESSVLKLWKSSCSLCSEKYKFVFILRNEFCLTLSLLRHVLTMWLINWLYEMKTWMINPTMKIVCFIGQGLMSHLV